MNGVMVMDNNNRERFEEIDQQVDGIILYLLKKYAVKNDFPMTQKAELQEETEAETQ
ncbi:Uncharacterised protein [Legionella wadsworthii]|uniref:Uncharacterized protein n=1 Tax=Legionella wadsworthii TaxID=28088 RepID=A0A378LWX1_9GAMM|nr:hypothetical protein [Legionella wadsworthii]STY28541.1 Uncharacterised protein [Legionella wadsworthii]